MKTFDVAIIGAGIVGAACAAALAREGLVVAVIEASSVAGGSTAAGMGHIVVMDDSDAQFALTRYSQTLWNNFAAELPASCEYEFCGTIWVAADEEEMLAVRRKKEFYESRGVTAEILDAASLRTAEPNLNHDLVGGLRVKDDSVVYQPQAAQVLLKKATDRGAELFTGQKVIAIDNDGVTLADSTKIQAAKMLVAAGSLSGELATGIKIRKKKGHLIITDRYPRLVRHQLIELGYLKSAHAATRDSVAFNVQPRITNQILLGSSRQFDAPDNAVDQSILNQMVTRAFRFMPELRDVSAIRVWTGSRPATPDNLPYIGRHPVRENIYIAAGHEGLGITTSLGTAELLTDQILGRESAIDRAPYSPSRFN